MRLAVIGGSASGLYSAILIKRDHPGFEVALFEKNDVFGKKLSATGNGKCNLLNKSLSPKAYHDNPLAIKLFEKYPYPVLEKALKELGVQLTEFGDLVYPSCLHATTYSRFLADTALSLGVNLCPNHKLLSYKKEKEGYSLKFEGQEEYFDKVVFALGGKSQANLGSDGSFVDELQRHGYKTHPFMPSLCPIKLKEKVKKLFGIRHKALLKVLVHDEVIYEEDGEILFKEDGLSGIAAMNASSYLIRERHEAEIVLDLFPNLTLEDLRASLEMGQRNNPLYFLDTLLVKNLKEYILYYIGAHDKKALTKADLGSLALALKGLCFHYARNYGFDQSQVSFGGIDIEEIGEKMESKREKGVYFVGEMLDVDGVCGGYNLSFALASSLEVASL